MSGKQLIASAPVRFLLLTLLAALSSPLGFYCISQITGNFPNVCGLTNYFILIVLAVTLSVLLVFSSGTARKLFSPQIPTAHRIYFGIAVLTVLACGGAGLLESEKTVLMIWVIALSVSSIAMLSYFFLTHRPSLSWSLSSEIALPLLTVIPCYLFLFLTWDLPQYYVWGDEGEFFNVAEIILEERTSRVFYSLGAFRSHPSLVSSLQAAFLVIVDHSLWGVRASSAAASCIGAAGVFYFLRFSFDRLSSFFGTVVAAYSIYNIQFSHLSYNNIWMVVAITLPVVLLFLGCRTKSPPLIWLSGVTSGILVYFTYFALVGCALLGLLLLSYYIRSLRRSSAILWGLGVCAALGPFALHISSHLQAATHHFHTVSQSGFERLVHLIIEPECQAVGNLTATLAAPLYFKASWHHVDGVLFDPISGACAAIGFAFCLVTHRTFQTIFILMFFICCAVVGGYLSPYPNPPLTRLIFLIPLVGILAGIGHFSLHSLLGARTKLYSTLILSGLVIAINFNSADHYLKTQDPLYRAKAKYLLELKSVPGQHIWIAENGITDFFDFMSRAYGSLGNITMIKEMDASRLLPQLLSAPDPFNLFVIDTEVKDYAAVEKILSQHGACKLRPVVWPGGRPAQIEYTHCSTTPASSKSISDHREHATTSMAMRMASVN